MKHKIISPFQVLSLLAVFFVIAASGGDEVGVPDLNINQKLILAAYNLNIDEVKNLIAKGADVNATFYKESNKSYNKLFMSKWTHGYSCVAHAWTALMAVASSEKHPPPTKTYENTEQGGNESLEDRKKIPQEMIIDRDNKRLAIAKILVENGAMLDVEDGYGATALNEAIYLNYESLALYLIGKGAKVDLKVGIYIDGPSGITAVHRASGNPKILAALINAGAKINVKDSTEDTPLHWALREKNNFESIKLLVNAGADVNAPDNRGNTPLHMAVRNRGADVVKLLVEAGADANAKNKDGKTPLLARWSVRALTMMEGRVYGVYSTKREREMKRYVEELSDDDKRIVDLLKKAGAIIEEKNKD